MAVIRQSEANRIAEQAIAIDLGDLRAQGEALIAHARAEARRIIDAGLAQRQRLLSDASRVGHAEGFERGVREGRESGRAAALEESRPRIDELETAWKTALQRFEHDRGAMLLQCEQDVLTLAVMLAGSVVKRAVEADPTLVRDQVREAIRAAARSSRVLVAVHPEDEPLVRQALPVIVDVIGRSTDVELTTDPALERGGCLVRTPGGGIVDARLHVQIDRIARTLLGSAPTQADAAATGEGS